MFKGSEWIAFFHALKAIWAFLSLSFVFAGGGGVRGSSFSNSIDGAGASSAPSSSTSGAGATASAGSTGSEWVNSGTSWAEQMVERRDRKMRRPRALFEQWWAMSDHLGWPKAESCGEMREWRRHYL